jgi:predicted RNA-binding Zn-ribbon protein involved in translation (DUF1610 family)
LNAGAWLVFDILLFLIVVVPASRPLKNYDRWRRLRCTQCRYNIVMQKPGERCPECGLEIPERPNLPRPKPPPPLLSRVSLLTIAAASLAPELPSLLRGFRREREDSAFLICMTIFSSFMTIVVFSARHRSWKKNRCIRCRHHLPAPAEAADRCPNCGALIPDPQTPV